MSLKREGENQKLPEAKRPKLEEVPIHSIEQKEDIPEWCQQIGHNLIQSVELKVGDQVIHQLRHCQTCGHTHDDTVPGLRCEYYMVQHELRYGTPYLNSKKLEDLLPKNK
jgi:hypothetical protein